MGNKWSNTGLCPKTFPLYYLWKWPLGDDVTLLTSLQTTLSVEDHPIQLMAELTSRRTSWGWFYRNSKNSAGAHEKSSTWEGRALHVSLSWDLPGVQSCEKGPMSLEDRKRSQWCAQAAERGNCILHSLNKIQLADLSQPLPFLT